MSFFDNYQDIAKGGDWINGPGKQFLIQNGVAFHIKGLVDDPENQYGPRWVAFCDVPNEETGDVEERKIGFPYGTGADSRDAMLKAMYEYFKGDDAEPVKVKLEQPNRAILIIAA